MKPTDLEEVRTQLANAILAAEPTVDELRVIARRSGVDLAVLGERDGTKERVDTLVLHGTRGGEGLNRLVEAVVFALPHIAKNDLEVRETRRVHSDNEPALGGRARQMTQQSVDVLILAALPRELEAIRANSGPWTHEHDPESGLHYWLTTAYHGLRIAAVGFVGMGPVKSAVATAQAVEVLHPKRVLLVGICGGIAGKVHLGDICVSEQVVDYDLGKVKEGEYAPRWVAFGADTELLAVAKHFTSDSWIKTVMEPRPGAKAKLPQVHFGTILTGSKVVADAAMVETLTSTWSEAIGIEMEGGGAAAALHSAGSHPPLLIVKGVCDLATAAKNDKWQPYAADAAARYAMSLLVERGTSALSQAPAQSFPSRHVDPFQPFGWTTLGVRTAMTTSMNVVTLRAVCQDLRIDWEELPNRDTKTGAAIDIIESCICDRRPDELLVVLRQIKPGLVQPPRFNHD
jgi:nucleoside phosphorylase